MALIVTLVVCLCRLSFGGRGALRHGPPSLAYEPLTAVLHPSRSPALLAGRSMRGPELAGLHITPGWHVSSGIRVARLTPDAATGTVAITALSHLPSVTGTGVCLTQGKWQYEVTVTRAGRASIGWATSSYFGAWEAFSGVGSGSSSVGFAFDGRSSFVLHDGKTQGFGKKWAYGDVLTVGVDVEAGTATFALNGSVAEPFGSVPLKVSVPHGGWLVPALSLRSDFTGTLNLGAIALTHPLPGFRPLAQFLPQ